MEVMHAGDEFKAEERGGFMNLSMGFGKGGRQVQQH